MPMDVVQIVNALPRYDDGHKHTIDPEDMANSLSRLIMPMGQVYRKIALVANDDERSFTAYTGAGYDARKISGDREAAVRRFIRETIADTEQSPPKRMVLVSDDPEFAYLCQAMARQHTELSVWADSTTAPSDLKESRYGFCPLEKLLPNLKVPRINVRIDLENIFIGLVKRGWRPNMQELVEAIRQAVKKQARGEVVALTGYADFDELNRHHGGPNINWQKEFYLAGGESRYVVNQHGKNTADMKIHGDIRTVIEHDSNTAGAINVIGLVTMDRDFAHVIKEVKLRGKRAIVLGLQDGLSRELQTLTEVCYLDEYLKLPRPGKQTTQRNAPPRREDAALMMRVGAWMNRNRWRFVFRDLLEEEFRVEAEGLAKLIADGWLSATPNSPFDTQGRARQLEPNPNHASACAARYLAGWIPDRVNYCLNRKGMPHIDSNFLASGMARDRNLAEMGVGQTRFDAESWLHTAATAKLVVAKEQDHPQTPGKRITTWWLPEEEATATAAPDAEDESNNPPNGQFGNAASRPSLSHLRDLLMRGLDDNDLNCVLLDHFVEVYRKFESNAPKFTKVQGLLDHVERCNEHNKLLDAIKKQNPTLFEEPEDLKWAA